MRTTLVFCLKCVLQLLYYVKYNLNLYYAFRIFCISMLGQKFVCDIKYLQINKFDIKHYTLQTWDI